MSKQARRFSGRWFRAYDEALDDPKIQMLSDKLHRFWWACLCLASKHEGYLPPVQEIAWRLRKSPEVVADMIAELYERRLLDREGETFSPHNWAYRQFESDISTSRVREFRERKRNAAETSSKRDETVSETAPEQTHIQNRADTYTETELRAPEPPPPIPFPQKPQPPKPTAADLDHISLRWQEFWDLYPRKQRQDFAASQYLSLVTVHCEAAVFACLSRYLASDEVARGVVANPDKWLFEQHRNGWQGDWPRARDSPRGNGSSSPARPLSVTEQARENIRRRAQQQAQQQGPEVRT